MVATVAERRAAMRERLGVGSIADKKRTAQEASVEVRRQKKALAVTVPLPYLFPEIGQNDLSIPVEVKIVPVTGLSETQAASWVALWKRILECGEEVDSLMHAESE